MRNTKMLAIDLGASSGRGIVGSFNGEKLSLRENHRFANGPVMMNGRLYWDIMRIFGEIKTSLHNCALGEDADIKSIGIDTWGVDYGLLDRNGRLLSNPVNYRDSRTDGVPDEVFAVVPRREIYDKTGIQSLSFNTLYQLYAEKTQDPERFAAADKLLFIPDLLNYFLTGVMRAEYTDTSTGALLDARGRDYAFDMLGRLGIPRHLFSALVQPGSRVGGLLPEITGEVGDIRADVYNVASHDTASAVISVPAKNGEDFVYISSGTWSLMGMELHSPRITGESFKNNFTNEGGAENTIRFLKNIMGLWLVQESKRQFEREGVKYSYQQMSDAAEQAEPFVSLIDPDDPSFIAPGNMPKRIAEYCVKTGQRAPESIGALVRCIMESLALCYRRTFLMLSEMSGKKAAHINVVGGGAKDSLLCSFTASACGVPVYAGPVEATATGNIAMQAIALGEMKNVAEAREVIARSFPAELYQPSADRSGWDAAYERFLALMRV